MRLLLLNYEYPPLGGGAAFQTRLLARRFAERGHTVTVITSGFRGLPPVSTEDGVRILRVPALRRAVDRSSVLQMAAYLVAALPVTLLLCLIERPHGVLSFFLLPTGALGWLVSRLFGIPHVVSLRGADVPSSAPDETERLYRRLRPVAERIGRDAAAVRAVGDDLAAMARADFPSFAHKIGVIYNGIEEPIKETIVKSSLTRFLFVGRLVPHKRLDMMLRALAGTPGDWRLDVLGDGPARHGLEALVLQLGLEDRVAFHGWLSSEEVYAAMRASHWLVLPSLTEGLSMAGLQACSLGVPLIGSDAPGLRGFIEPDVTGLLVDGGEDVWRETLTAAVEHPELWERLSKHCADHVLSRYSVSRSADEYLQVFGNVARNDG